MLLTSSLPSLPVGPSAIDLCGNEADPKEEVVTIQDTTPPLIADLAPSTTECKTDCHLSGDASDCFSMATASDSCDADVTLTESGVSRSDATCGDNSLAGVYVQSWNGRCLVLGVWCLACGSLIVSGLTQCVILAVCCLLLIVC